MSRKRLSKAVAIGTMVVTLSSNLSFGQPTVFTDISGHWAKDYIEDIYTRKITTGYPDATFKPQGNISRLESVVMIAKLMGYSDSEGAYYTNQYKQKLQDNNIPDWAQGAVGYALFNDILLENDLKGLVSTNQQTHAKRYEVATYIGRVLQYGAGKQPSSVYVIPYIDEMSIPSESAPYIDLLLKNNILDKSSNEGRFLPNNLITRAEVSKLISISAEILDGVSTGNPTTPPDSNTDKDTDTKVETKTVTGDIDNIILGSKNIISISNGSKKEVYDIASNANIKVDGKTAGISQLQQGQSITATVENNIVVDIKATSTSEVIEGYFYYFLDGATPSVYISDNKENIKIFTFTSSSKVYLNDKQVKIGDLNNGDVVTLKHKDGKVVEIEAEPKEKNYEGVIDWIDNPKKDEVSIEVKLENGTLKAFTIDSKATIKRDRKTIDFDEMKVGDEVEIITEYDKVIELNAYSVQRTEKGYIKSINLGSKTEITIEKYDGNVEVFEITPKTSITIEDKKAGIYDLRIGYEVELELENDEVVWMESYRKLQAASYQGKVIKMDSRNDEIQLEIRAGEEIVVEVDSDTIYNDEYGDIIAFRDINRDDEIVVVAEDNGYYILAKRILVMIRR